MQPEGTLLLRTKLDVPPPRTHTLARERLLALIPHAPETRLLLLSAPAGFGKTTLLATWCRALHTQRGTAVAWLALDERDNDPTRFLAYLVTALEQALTSEGIDTSTPTLVDPIGADVETVLTALVNAIAVIDGDLVLVLDDYHLISAPAIHAAVAFLLEHLPNQACLAIGSRADPPLPLARLRAREQLIELRAADLRFTPAEVQAFFTANNMALTPEEIQAVSTHVEGWPAGVQLMVLALRATLRERTVAQESTPSNLPAGHVLGRLNGSQQHVFAYLADDVFEQQPAHRKAFLLQTAILERMCGPLCDAVLGVAPSDRSMRGDPMLPAASAAHSYSRLVLDEIEQANLFVMPLDSERRWYRYHNLFRAFLCARLNRESPLAVSELHRRASAWYEQHQLWPCAIDHALAAGECVHAAGLIEQLAITIVERGEYAMLHRWLEQLPEPILAARPGLCLWAAWAALLAGEVERIEPLLCHAEEVWRANADQRKLAEAAHLQAHLARLRLDPLLTISAAQQALANLAPESLTLHAGSVLALGAGQLITGDLERASVTLTEAYVQCQAHNFLGMLVALRCLGDLAAQRGQLHAAAAHYRQVIEVAGQRSLWERWVATLRLGDLARERNDLDQALELLNSALTSAEQAHVAVYLPAGYIALARTQQARGDRIAAQSTLERALHAAHQLGSLAYARQIRAEQARLALAQGDLRAAQRWQQEVLPQLESTFDGTSTIEACVLERVLIAQRRSGLSSAPVQPWLTRLHEQAIAHGRTGDLIEILALNALAKAATGHRDQAITVLQQALLLAMPEGYARIFLDEGASMAMLLAECRSRLLQHAHGLANEDARQLLCYIDALLVASGPERSPQMMQLTDSARADSTDTLVEPLSERELEVLELIARGASNQAIATTLVISIGTVKSHINHILGKLAACNRTEAVSHAREHGLLTK